MNETDDTDFLKQLQKDAEACAADFGWHEGKFPPGKMEGNPWYVPWLYHQIILEGEGTTVCGWEIAELMDDEKELFDLEDTTHVGIREDDNGFVRYKLLTQEEYFELYAEEQRLED